jgi:hypothetical protein
MVVHAYNPSNLGSRDKRTKACGQPELTKKGGETIFQKNMPGMVVSTCDPSYLGSRGRKIPVQLQFKAGPWQKCEK